MFIIKRFKKTLSNSPDNLIVYDKDLDIDFKKDSLAFKYIHELYDLEAGQTGQDIIYVYGVFKVEEENN